MKNTTDRWQHTRDWLAGQMGVDEQRKTEVYLEIAQSATLKDATYWLQIIFSAGIATIGLALSSPAVIIGAMLISPLMGPILSLGLSLAAGDFILLVRAIANLALSCAVAISFAMLLIFSLPFKEATSEILARTTPNTLDLGVALFSGAIGTIATCRPVKGVITSIPGVSIAVALMPPLCVVGYGVGIAFSLNFADGLQISRGGGLLFLTNLVAIAFASTLVFLALHIDTDKVRERVKLWEATNLESNFLQELLGRYPVLKKLRPIGSLPGRLFVGLLAIMALLIPLSNSFVRLSEEVSQKQQQNMLRRTATNIWQNNFSNSSNDQPRSSIERLSITEQNQSIIVRLSIFTSRLYSSEERDQYVQELARKLNRDPQKVQLLLTEIPTASNEILTKKEETILPAQVKPPSIGELQEEVLQTLDLAISNLSLPPNAKLLDYAMTTGRSKSAQITITYLSDRPMSEDAKLLVINDVQRRMDISNAEVSLEHINQAIAEITFAENALTFPEDFNAQLDQTGGLLQKYPDLNLMLSINLRALENKALRRGRFQAIASYLQSKWQIESSRVTLSPISSSNKIISSAISDNLSDVNNNPVETTLPTLPQDGKVIFQFKM
ncbi:MAG: hypothetical protein AUK48_08975 [Oscillatoriales cyanobacterium CG2_30_44_21]|nr:MAG: hypothetical protein AUK48_08975 [Oscillatoriales cyanobacterium CG2_30_44_21]